jgi:hypothetical protein
MYNKGALMETVKFIALFRRRRGKFHNWLSYGGDDDDDVFDGVRIRL